MRRSFPILRLDLGGRRWSSASRAGPDGSRMDPASLRMDRLSGRSRWRFMLALAVLLAAGLGKGVLGQSAVVTRNVHLRAGPSTDSTILRTLHPGDELTVLAPQKTNNYWDVRTGSGEDGWVWSYNVHVEPADSAAADSDSLPVVFHGCGLEGTAQYEARRARNRLKNRRTTPTSADMDTTAGLSRMLAPGDDRDRWSDQKAATIVGYVLHVKPGGRETVNCGASALRYRDTHIEVTANATDTLKTQRVIVEVTPRWRALEKARGNDWSTEGLRDRLEGHCAAFTGWFFFDSEHADEAENSAPGRDLDWRATAWEVHPVTAIHVVPCPAQT